MKQFFEKTILNNVLHPKKQSCIICHMQIFIDKEKEFNEINRERNYLICSNGHYIHIEPCFTNWFMKSNNCPVCTEKFNDYIISQFQPFVEKIKKEQQEKLEQEKRIQKLIEDVENSKIQVQKSIIKDMFIQAQKLIEDKSYDAALNILFDVIDNYEPENIDAKFLIGKTNYLKGKYDLAVSNLMKVLKIQYDYPLAFYYLGKSYEMMGLKEKQKWAFERAKINLSELIEKEPNEKLVKIYKNLLEEVQIFLDNFTK